MKVHQIYTHSHLRNFSYLLCDSKGQCYCIDPFDGGQILDFLEHYGLKLRAIINTHEHYDHYCGNKRLVEALSVEVWAHENAKGKIPGVDRFLTAGERIKLDDGFVINVLDTPGHTFAHLCLLISDSSDKPQFVFTGDTLFNAGVGNCHNGGDPEVLYQTISSQFQGLADECIVYPGHEYLENNLKFTLNREPNNQKARDLLEQAQGQEESEDGFIVTNLKKEREINTFLRLSEKEIKEHLNLSSSSSDKQVFLKLRELRNKW